MSTIPLTSATGVYSAKCRVCEKEIARFPVLEVPIIGQPDAKAQKVFGILLRHITLSHPDRAQAGAALYADFQAFLLLSQFEINDPTIQRRFELIRAGLQSLSRKFMLTDAHIEQMVVKLDAANQLTAENVTKAIKEIRDVLSEQGQYAPTTEQPQSNLIV